MAEGYCIFGGRFQPFHIGHLALVAKHLDSCHRPLVIGMVNPDPVERLLGDDEDWLRFGPTDNPLTYWERVRCIKLSLEHAKIDSRVQAIVPMPRPSVNIARANRYLPPPPRQFILRSGSGDEIEDWKANRYRQNGDHVSFVEADSIHTLSQVASATLIRYLVAVDNSVWRTFVAPSVGEYLVEIGFPERVKKGISAEDAMGQIRMVLKQHPLRELVADVVGDIDGLHGDARAAGPTLLATKLLQAKVFAGEVKLTVSAKEAATLAAISAELFAADKLLIRPRVTPIGGEMCQVEMTLEARAVLLNRADLGGR